LASEDRSFKSFNRVVSHVLEFRKSCLPLAFSIFLTINQSTNQLINYFRDSGIPILTFNLFSVTIYNMENSNEQFSKGKLIIMVCARFIPAFLVLSAMFLIPAGTFAYWEAWAYMAVLFIPMFFVFIYLIKKDPELLARRMKVKEKEEEQKLIIKLSYIPFLISFLLPGFDKRFGWSNMPLGVVVIADILVLLGYGIFFLVLKENPYASRIVEVEPKQTVITSGPYEKVRHPMYSGVLLLYIFTPLALGSYWAVIPAMFTIPVIVARILNEEEVLSRDLEGYEEYMQKTRYRLIPGIW
jgi:protein-S-isoprenylcysteine O-methyltransferase Ste14